MRTHTSIIDLEFLRSHNPDEDWERFSRLLRLGEGKVFLAGGDEFDDFLDEDELGQAWESGLNGRYGYFDASRDGFMEGDRPGFWPKSNVVLAAGDELKDWASRHGLPVYSSMSALSKASRRRPFEDRWKQSKKSIALGRDQTSCASWKAILDRPAARLKPSRFNAAMLLDMHLFNDRDLLSLVDGKTCSGVQNLQALIEGFGSAFRPQKLLVCCGVMVRHFEMSHKEFLEESKDRWLSACLNEEGMREMHTTLLEELQDVGFTGELELVGMRQKGADLHFREFMTNHHLLSSDKGFNVFHKNRIDQGDFSMKCLLHDLEWDDDELDSELVSQWRVNLEVMRDVMRKGPRCVGADGRVCQPSALRHPFLLPLERPKNYHDQ